VAFPDLRGVAETAGFSSVQSTPLISSSGALFGIISTHGAHPPTRQQLVKITTLARQNRERAGSIARVAGASVASSVRVFRCHSIG
jgi:hypothetical protein